MAKEKYFKFNHAVGPFHSDPAEEKTPFPAGVSVVCDEIQNDPYFIICKEAGIITECEKPEAFVAPVDFKAELKKIIDDKDAKIAELELKAEADAAVIAELDFDLSAAAGKITGLEATISELTAALSDADKKDKKAK